MKLINEYIPINLIYPNIIISNVINIKNYGVT